jgi:hypothetical protein
MKRHAYLLPLAVVLVLAFTGCTAGKPLQQAIDRAPAQVGIVNHTGNYIYSASVDGAGGGWIAGALAWLTFAVLLSHAFGIRE